MFRAALLSLLAAVAVAKPGGIGLGHGTVHTAIVGSVPVSAGTVPLGVTHNTVGVVNSGYSQSSRVDYATPIIGAPVAIGGLGGVGGLIGGLGGVGGVGLGGGAGLAGLGVGLGHGR